MKHPLLNEDSSSHYLMADGVEAIERLEEMYSKEELATWAKITAMKYRLRIGRKDEVAKEAKKIRTYEDYYEYLTRVGETTTEESEKEPSFPWTDEEAEMLKKIKVRDNCLCEECREDKKTRTKEELEVMQAVMNAPHGATVDMKGVTIERFMEMRREDELAESL